MKNVLIVGATGMVGSLILEEALQSEEVEKVVSIVRQPTERQHEKLMEIIHHDFGNYANVKEVFRNIDIAYFCVGVYTGAVPRDEFRKITVDFTEAFANTLLEYSPDASLCFLSGMGADRTEKSRVAFAHDKGVAENYLLALELNQLYIFRPGYIYPVTPRKEPNFSYRLFRFLYPLMNKLAPSASVTSEHLAKVMFKIGMQGADKETFENREIREIEV